MLETIMICVDDVIFEVAVLRTREVIHDNQLVVECLIKFGGKLEYHYV